MGKASVYNSTGRRLTETKKNNKNVPSDNGIKSNVLAQKKNFSSSSSSSARNGRKSSSSSYDDYDDNDNSVFDETREDFDDEVETYHKNRSHVGKVKSQKGRGRFDDDDDDDEDDDEEQVEEVLGLDMYDDDEDDDDDDEEDEDDDADGNEVDNDNKQVSWGSKRDYYNADDASDQATDSEDEEQMEAEEEQEALRIQKQLAQFMDDENEEDASFESRTGKASKKGSNSAKKSASSSSSSPASASATTPATAALNLKKKSSKNDLDEDEMTVETITKDVASLSSDEKLELIMKDSPELLELLGEFQAKIKDVVAQIIPLLEKAKKGEFKTNKGVSYLEVKLHLLLSYCINICFYLVLKSEGKQVQDHPVIEHLVKLRTIIERLRPLDSKLKYQIDKLVKVAATGAVDTLDPTRFKANPKALAASRFNTADDDEDLDEESAFGAKSSGGDKKTKKKRESEEENGDNDNEERFSSELAGANAALSGKYVPPKIASVAFDGDSATNKRLQKEEKLKRKALKSSLIKDIQEEFSDKPREIRDTAGFGGKDILPDQEEEDYRRRFEEDHFVRLTTKKKTGKAARLPNELNSLVDFGDIGGLDRLVSRGGNDLEDDADLRKVFKKSSLREKLNEMRNRDSEEGSTSRKKGRFDAPIEEDDYYKEILAKTTERKEKKAMEKESRNMMADEEDEDVDGKRGISYQISKNKGLTPKRKKEVRNPRVKHRMSYEKALLKRKSQVPSMQTDSGKYGGESTGIRSGLARSVALA